MCTSLGKRNGKVSKSAQKTLLYMEKCVKSTWKYINSTSGIMVKIGVSATSKYVSPFYVVLQS